MKGNMKCICFSLALSFLLVLVTSSSYPKPLDENSAIQYYLEKLKGSGYNRNILPTGNGGHGLPVEVLCSMYLLDIHKVDDFSMDYKVQFYFRQSWNDSRLAYLDQDISKIILNDAGLIWTPDLFFVQEREGIHNKLISPNTFISILPNGEVKYSVRVSVTLSCPMDLSKFPHDVQKCTFSVESYGRTRDKLLLFWDERRPNPVGYNENSTTLLFKLTGMDKSVRHIIFTFGEYTALRITLTLQRKSGFFFTKVYIPFIILVVLSWLPFWIPSKIIAIRLSLLLVILYLMVHLESGINNYIPPTSYTKGSDVWVAVCESFVFASFLEFIVVNLIARNTKKLKEKIYSNDPEAQGVLESDTKESQITSISAASIVASRLLKEDNIHKRIDKICGIVFPILFVFFNFIYWLVYCIGY